MIFSGEPQPTPADLAFRLADVPVRVSAWFWAAAALLGWGVCQSLAEGDQRQLLAYLIVWMGVVFVSILVHEMGHALAYRRFGLDSRVVLVHFGGITIPQRWGGRSIRSPLERILISAAGPAAQLLLTVAIVLVLKIAGYRVPFPIRAIAEPMGLYQGARIPSEMVAIAILFLLQVNIFWPLLNLLPVPPLDGGQIMRDGLAAVGIADAARSAAIVGAVTGGLVAWWAYGNGQEYMAILFAVLAVSCVQSLRGSWP
jgi:stage IV sporulation protein FB